MKIMAYLFVLIALPSQLFGSEPGTYKVYQPFDLPDGIFVSPVTYTGYYGPGNEVEMTCWENRIYHRDPDWRGNSKKTVQENAAFTSRLKVSTEGARSWPNDVDTISVTLDVSQLTAVRPAGGWRNTVVLAATVECMKANAGQHAPRVHFLAIRIVGPRKYRKYGGVFEVSGYKCGPRTRQFGSSIERP
jgi:hypothetical protein